MIFVRQKYPGSGLFVMRVSQNLKKNQIIKVESVMVEREPSSNSCLLGIVVLLPFNTFFAEICPRNEALETEL